MSNVRRKVAPYINGLELESHPAVATRTIGPGIASPSFRDPHFSLDPKGSCGLNVGWSFSTVVLKLVSSLYIFCSLLGPWIKKPLSPLIIYLEDFETCRSLEFIEGTVGAYEQTLLSRRCGGHCSESSGQEVLNLPQGLPTSAGCIVRYVVWPCHVTLYDSSWEGLGSPESSRKFTYSSS